MNTTTIIIGIGMMCVGLFVVSFGMFTAQENPTTRTDSNDKGGWVNGKHVDYIGAEGGHSGTVTVICGEGGGNGHCNERNGGGNQMGIGVNDRLIDAYGKDVTQRVEVGGGNGGCPNKVTQKDYDAYQKHMNPKEGIVRLAGFGACVQIVPDGQETVRLMGETTTAK